MSHMTKNLKLPDVLDSHFSFLKTIQSVSGTVFWTDSNDQVWHCCENEKIGYYKFEFVFGESEG